MRFRESYIEIDLKKLEYNYSQLSNYSEKEVFAVVKDNAYGHGAVEICRKLEELNCKYVCVANLEEAIELRDNGVKLPILILGYVKSDYFYLVDKYDLTLSVSSIQYAKELADSNLKIKVHLQIDTGMNRFGIKRIDLLKEALAMLDDSSIIVEGIYTHLYDADVSKNNSLEQLKRFYLFVDELNYDFKWIHTSNSNGTIQGYDERSNACRVGLALYGIKDIASELELKPVLSLYSEVVQIKKVFKGETIGYNGDFVCPKDGTIAIVPLGYGDGFIRKNTGRFVAIENHPYQIVGKICMDQFMLWVDDNCQVHDKVEIIGGVTSLAKMATELDVIPYEILVLLNTRLEREYVY